MGKFLELSRSEVSHLADSLLIRWLPKSALLSNVANLYLTTNMSDTIPTTFYAYNGNISGENAFVLAKQDKKKYYNAVVWTICGPEAKYVVSEMFEAFQLLVDLTIRNCMPGVHIDIKDGIADIFRKNGAIHEWEGCHAYFRRGDVNVNTIKSTKLPKGVTLVTLDPEGVKKLFKYWEYAEETSFDEVLDTVSFVPSVGVKVDDELVSWGYTATDGAIHGLYTMEEHRGKGYSKIVVETLGEMLAKRGLHGVTQVEGHNVPSIKLMLSTGFKFAYTISWFEYSVNSTDITWAKS